ncbi:MAG: hypothetical protein V3V62_12645 [bacterium]
MKGSPAKGKRPGRGERRIGRGLLLAALSIAMSGCALIVTKKDYEKGQKRSQQQLQVIRRQLLAHTRTLAKHGKSLDEARLQIRDTLSFVRKMKAQAARAKLAKARMPKSKAPRAKAASSAKAKGGKGYPVGTTLTIRRSYRSLPLNYAGGYRAPRGSRYPYTLPPGTRVRSITRDRRGFTRVVVRTGRWKGKKMWVRTIWLIERRTSRKRRRS